MDQTDREIIKKCQEGQTEEFARLYDKYAGKIYKFIYFKTHQKELAEDLTSQTFLKALKNVDSMDPELGSFCAWLYRIARNTVIDHYRMNKQGSVNIEDVWDLATSIDLIKETDNRIRLEKIKEYMKGLSGEQRDIVVLRVWEGMTYKEIAQIIGKKEDNCKMIFSRTVGRMRREMLAALLLLKYFV